MSTKQELWKKSDPDRRKDWAERQRRYNAGEAVKRLEEYERTMGERRDKAHDEEIEDRDRLKGIVRETGKKHGWPPLIENAEIGLQQKKQWANSVLAMNKGKPPLDRKHDRLRMGLIGWLCFGVDGAKNPPRLTGSSWESKADRMKRLEKHTPAIAEIFQENPNLYCDVREFVEEKDWVKDWMPDLDEETLRKHISKVRDSAIEFAKALDID